MILLQLFLIAFTNMYHYNSILTRRTEMFNIYVHVYTLFEPYTRKRPAHDHIAHVSTIAEKKP